MFIDIRRWPLARQIAAVSILLSLLVFVIIIGFVWVKGHEAARHVAQDEGNLYALRVRDLVEAEYGHAAQNVQGRMAILRGLLGGQPSVLDETAAVGERPGVRIMKAPNGTVLNNNLALLTDLKGKLDGDPAVMVKQGDDFVRVATLLKDPQGKSLVGSSLARDGKETASLLAGKAYSGVVMRNGKFYMSIFEPVLDRSGVVAGAISFRQDLSPQLEAMRDRIGKMKIAETGYAYVLVPGRDVGDTRFLSHPQFAGKSVAEANNPRLAEVIGRVRSVGEGTLSYDWPDATKDGQMREKIVAVARAPSWGWIVVAGSYADEFSGETRRLALQLSVMALLCAGSFVFALVWGLSRQLRPLAPMLDEMNRIGNGDLRPSAMLHANRDSANEVDRIALVTEVMRSNIAGLIGRIHGSTQQLGSAADGVTGAAAEVAQASQQQSDSASSLAAAIEELSVSVTHVSDGASEAREVSDAARSAAEKGQRTVSAMISGMRRIEDEIRVAGEVVHQLGDRTAQISDVVRVIKDVAEQTNLLALNAAIEAARAGEQGRGFAVVADEVRKLAERTAASTSEIAGTIATVQQEASAIVDRIEALAVRVSEGVTLANDAEAELASIGERSARASDAVAGIDDGVREQSAASQDIARGVERIAKMAECNLATTEANHATAARVRELAHELADSVSSFRV